MTGHTPRASDKWFIRAKDISLLFAILTLLGYLLKGSSRVDAWDRSVEVANKAAADIIGVRLEMAAQTAILSRMEKSLDRLSRQSDGHGGD